MNIKNLFLKYKKSLEPSKGQEKRVYSRVLKELDSGSSSEAHSSNLFLNLSNVMSIFNFKRYKYVYASLAVILFIGLPLLVGTSSLNQLTNQASVDIRIAEDFEIGESDEATGFLVAEQKAGIAEDFAIGSSQPSTITEPRRDNSNEDKETPDDDRVKEQEAVFTLESKNIEEDFRQVKELAGKFDGYVVSSDFSGVDNLQTGTVIMRIPADKFDLALQDLKGIGSIVSESVETIDRQNEYTEVLKLGDDLEKQLEDKKAELADAKEEDKEDVQKEIDLLERRIGYNTDQRVTLESDVLFSTIQVTLETKQGGLIGSGSIWSDLLGDLEMMVVFWTRVAIWVGPPVLLLIVVIKGIRKGRKK